MVGRAHTLLTVPAEFTRQADEQSRKHKVERRAKGWIPAWKLRLDPARSMPQIPEAMQDQTRGDESRRKPEAEERKRQEPCSNSHLENHDRASPVCKCEAEIDGANDGKPDCVICRRVRNQRRPRDQARDCTARNANRNCPAQHVYTSPERPQRYWSSAARPSTLFEQSEPRLNGRFRCNEWCGVVLTSTRKRVLLCVDPMAKASDFAILVEVPEMHLIFF